MSWAGSTVTDTSTGMRWRLSSDPVIEVDSRDYNVSGMRSQRWSVLALFEDDRDGFILVQKGMSAVKDERTYAQVCRCVDIEAVAEALGRKSRNGLTYYTRTARALLIMAQKRYGRAVMEV